MHRHRHRPRLQRQARAGADPAHRISRFDQRHPRRRRGVQAADLHDDRAVATRSRQGTEGIAALRRAHRRADPRRHGHRASPAQRRRRHCQDQAGDRQGLCRVAAGGVPGRAESQSIMMKRDECFRILARHIKDEAVVATYSSAVDWVGVSPRPLNYLSIGAMGLDSSHGLGLALGRPDRRVVVLQGDGSLLMNLGSLVTIAAAAPKNLVHFVAHNDTYEANGGHPIPNPKVDFANIARAAGYAATYDFSDLRMFEQQIAHVLEQDGPVFATLHVEPSKPLKYDYASLYDPEKRKTFKAAWQMRSAQG